MGGLNQIEESVYMYIQVISRPEGCSIKSGLNKNRKYVLNENPESKEGPFYRTTLKCIGELGMSGASIR